MADIDDPIVREYMNSSDMNMAIASDIAYKHSENLANNPTDIANGRTNVMIEERLQNHKLIPAHSNQYVTTIKNMPKNQYIMAVRGTNVSSGADLASDTQLFFNQNVKRVDSVEKVYESFRKEQPTAKLTLTGHSLGAYVAHNIANKYNETFVGFDLPTSPFDLVSNFISTPILSAFHKQIQSERKQVAAIEKEALEAEEDYEEKSADARTKIKAAMQRAGPPMAKGSAERKMIAAAAEAAVESSEMQKARDRKLAAAEAKQKADEKAAENYRLSAGYNIGRTPEHRIYLTDEFDMVSVLTKYTNKDDIVRTLPQQESTSSLLGSHSIKNYIYEKNPPSTLVKTGTKKNTYYSMPHMATTRQTAKSVPNNVTKFFNEKKPANVTKFFNEKKPRRLRTGYENECLTKPGLKKCKQLNERKFY